MPDPDDVERHRGYLFGVAYRMLGRAADAEDVVQEAYLRWAARPHDDVQSPRAFLTTIVVRLCLDELRSARSRHEAYVGPWLPEPVLVDDRDPAAAAELADSLSMAFLVLLEELAPAERAAFLLHDVFGYGYDDIATILGRGAPACRQLVSRARHRVGERRHRFDADRVVGERLAQEFIAACAGGDVAALMELLAPDVVVWTDGGGVVKAARREIVGAAKAARFIAAVAATVPADADIRAAVVNAQPGVLIVVAGSPFAAVALDVVAGSVVGVRVVTNPQKLGAVGGPPLAAADLRPGGSLG